MHCRIQAQATLKKPQVVTGLPTQKDLIIHTSRVLNRRRHLVIDRCLLWDLWPLTLSLFVSLFCSASLLELFLNYSSVSCMTVIQTKPGNLLTVLDSSDKAILLECRPSRWNMDESVCSKMAAKRSHAVQKELTRLLASRKADPRKLKV